MRADLIGGRSSRAQQAEPTLSTDKKSNLTDDAPNDLGGSRMPGLASNSSLMTEYRSGSPNRVWAGGSAREVSVDNTRKTAGQTPEQREPEAFSGAPQSLLERAVWSGT